MNILKKGDRDGIKWACTNFAILLNSVFSDSSDITRCYR